MYNIDFTSYALEDLAKLKKSEPKAFKDDYVGSLFYFQYDETIKDVRQFDIATIPGFRSIVDVRKD